MSDSTVLVTGGSGYIGSHTVVELVDAGYQVVIVDNLANSKSACHKRLEMITGKSIPFYNLDLLDKLALHKLFSEHKIHTVIHFAALKAVGESVAVPLKYYRNNVGGLISLIECMDEFKVYNLVFSSSATVYGTPKYLPLDETHPVGECVNPYGYTKYFAEVILTDLHRSNPAWNIMLLRYFNPVGAHKSGLIGEDPQGTPNNLVPYITKVAAGILPHLCVYGDSYDTKDGTGVRDYIHVVDLAVGHVRALQKLVENQPDLRIYNLGTGRGYSVLEVVAAMEAASGKSIPYKICPVRAGDVATCFADSTRAQKDLGWRCERGLQEMCVDTWRWQSQNPNGLSD